MHALGSLSIQLSHGESGIRITLALALSHSQFTCSFIASGLNPKLKLLKITISIQCVCGYKNEWELALLVILIHLQSPTPG
jgi:hypothetical protein